MISRSTDVKGALRSRQRGFLLNPFWFSSAGLWTPASLPNLAVWYVADNPLNTVTSGDLSTIADKSGMGHAAVSGATANNAYLITSGLNGRSIWRGTSGSRAAFFEISSSADILKNVSGATMAVVNKMPATGVERAFFNFPIASSYNARAYMARTTTNANYVGGRRLDSDSFGSVTSSFTGTNWCSTIGILDFANSDAFISTNGTLVSNTSFLTPGNTSNTSALGAQIGGASSGSWIAYGDTAEMVVASSAISSTDRQKLEGYFAWQWGLQSDLPSGHPYKTAAPTV